MLKNDCQSNMVGLLVDGHVSLGVGLYVILHIFGPPALGVLIMLRPPPRDITCTYTYWFSVLIMLRPPPHDIIYTYTYWFICSSAISPATLTSSIIFSAHWLKGVGVGWMTRHKLFNSSIILSCCSQPHQLPWYCFGQCLATEMNQNFLKTTGECVNRKSYNKCHNVYRNTVFLGVY